MSEHVRNRLISGMLDKDMSQKLQLEQDNVTLEKVVDNDRHCELVKSQNESQVNFVTKFYNQIKRQQQRYVKRQQAPDRRQTEDSQPEVYAANVATCIDHRVHMLAQQKGSNATNVEKICHIGKMCRKSAKPSILEMKETVANYDTYICGSINCDDNNLKSQVGLLQTAHSWANAGIFLGGRIGRGIAFATINLSG